MRRQFAILYFCTFLTVLLQCSPHDRHLESILGELVDLRTELNELFKSPAKNYDHLPHDEEFVVHVNSGVADALWLANLTNTQLVGKMRGFPDLYVFRSHQPHNRSETHRIRRDLSQHQSDSRIFWSEFQQSHQRQKRDVYVFNDPFWAAQWEINGKNQNGGSMRIAETWKNYTGKGVIVSILDDGIDYTHEDLAQNYDPFASYDLNEDDEDPMPTMDEFNKHGTRCAGEVAMLANNSKCGVGVAFDSRIGGVRMLDGKVNDRIEAEGLSILINYVDIISASWGPADDGLTVEGPGKLAQMALEKGIREGRNSKGVIYVWASGNGGASDDCACDGYASSIYTFTVSGASASGDFPWYGESCASALATAFSSGNVKQGKIVTIDPQNLCTNEHTGTSASAPIAAGIIALALEANPSLTWREVQHLAVWTSNPAPLFHGAGWRKNGAGLWASSKFGFGLMDAFEMTQMAKNFAPIGAQQTCTTVFPGFKSRSVTNRMGLVISFKLTGCEGRPNQVRSLEHVQLIANIDSDSRGLLSIWLESPSGMISQVLHPRLGDYSSDGYTNWPFTSVHFWGENPKGTWKLHVDQIKSTANTTDLQSILKNITLVLYGTREIPKHAQTPRTYQNLADPQQPKSSYSSNEIDVDIADIEQTINDARSALTSPTTNKEKSMVAVDRLVRKIHEMNTRRKKRSSSTRIHAYEK